ncbi:hypothetical protein ACT4U9_11830 [Acinetobacter baumannii]|uniref:hypothetical protein n=1 Tax=Acinetobacter pittii TaxID=48296 RepID=UPI00194E0D62|nr:hypothetical protein [Acinetobacter pittii]MDC4501889.1 hypothetical protein [Acinetobacter baumannii]MDC4804979.1 hypothetical protein [Acinetobacter baumannii]MDC5008241.1 hypothetical protein [Acinetobacter baumannii]MDX7929043.1 hypothetical protein [Acinetobacter baumannii]QRQ11516.1 hypothetical protein I6J46_09860 [Acinetobacter pittii]
MTTLSTAIADYLSTPINSINDVKYFLSQYPTNVQQQFVSALYIGRDHIHYSSLRENTEISSQNYDHIQGSEYSRLIFEKGSNVATYLQKFRECAAASNFNIDAL